MAVYGVRRGASLASWEAGEPLSWILAIAAMVFAVEGLGVLRPEALREAVLHGILVGFVVHELAHRQVGRRYGARTEFVATGLGLAATVLSGFIPGIAILAPGYVRTVVWESLNPRGLAYAVAAGPASNIILAAVALAGRAAVGEGPAYAYLSGFAYINAYMALFNLIPIRPLDGEKIVRYSPAWWAALAALSVALLLAA